MVAPDADAGRRDWSRRTSAGASRRTWPRSARLTEIERLSTEREKTGVFLGAYAINPVNGERIPVWAADYVLADYGTGAIMAVPGARPARLDFARAFGLPIVAGRRSRRGGPRRRGRHRRRPATATWSTPGSAWTGWRDRGQDRAIIDVAGGRRALGERGDQLPAARLAALPAALLGRADPDHPLPVVRRGAGPGRPAAGDAARPARPGPGAEGRLAAGRRDRLGQRRPARSAAGRRSATPTRWTPSSTRPGTSCATCSPQYTDGPVRPGRGRRAGCRSTSTSAASSTRSCTCCTRGSSPRCCTTWAWSTSSSRSPRLLNQGQVINQGKAMSKSLGNGVDLGEQMDAATASTRSG